MRNKAWKERKISPAIKKLEKKILAERDKGNIVFWGMPGELMTVSLDDFVKQPAEGMLYDLNRLEEISLTFLKDPKWVNDFAVALTIRKLASMIPSSDKPDYAPQSSTADRATAPSHEGVGQGEIARAEPLAPDLTRMRHD